MAKPTEVDSMNALRVQAVRERDEWKRRAMVAEAKRLIRSEPVPVDLNAVMHAQLYVLHPDGSLSPAHASLPLSDSEVRRSFEKRMLDFGWRNFDGSVQGDPKCWYYDKSDLNARWVGWREAVRALGVAGRKPHDLRGALAEVATIAEHFIKFHGEDQAGQKESVQRAFAILTDGVLVLGEAQGEQT